MHFKNTYTRFGVISQLFHWLIFFLIAAQLYLIWVFETLVETDPSRGNYMFLHKSVGATILMLAILWIVWRWFNVRPQPLPSARSWQYHLAKITHRLLFLGIILMPLTGALMSMSFGRGIDWFGLYTIAPVAFIPQNEIYGGYYKTAHQLIAVGLIALVVLHLAGALVHHFIYKDTVLKRMLPFTRT